MAEDCNPCTFYLTSCFSPPNQCQMSAVTLHKGFGDTVIGRGTATLRLPRRRHKCLGKPFRTALRDEDPVSHPQAGAYLPIPSSWEDFKVYSLRVETLQNSQSSFGGCLLSLLQLSLPWKMPQGCNIKLLEGLVIEKVLSWKTGWFYGCI